MSPSAAYRWAKKASKLKGGSEGLAYVAVFTYFGIGVEADRTEAAALLKKAAYAGSLMAEAYYALCMLHGTGGVQKKEARAVKTITALAQARVPIAMKTLAELLIEGVHVSANKPRAIDWLRKAVDAEFPDAMALMGEWMALGTHVPKQEEEGFRLMKAAVDLGCEAAYLSLGNAAAARKDMASAVVWWKKGIGSSAEAAYRVGAEIVLNAPVDADHSEGFAFLEQSVDMGYSEGALLLGSLYCEGVRVSKDLKRGAKWFQRGEKMGNDRCTQQLGLRLTEEDAKDRELIQLGLTSLGTGVKNQDEVACKRLAELYVKGRYVKSDKERARKYLVLPALGGDLEAQLLLAELSDELGDPKTAVKWYDKAARQKNEVAAFRMAEHLENGAGVPMNLGTALEWYARVDTAESQFRQGFILLQGGAGAECDLKGATAAFKKASERGHTEATYRLGLHVRDGVGVDVDKKEAVALFTKAADEGSADASFALALCYREGYGSLKKDKKQATYFLETAAAAGHQEAKDLLKTASKKSGLKRLLH